MSTQRIGQPISQASIYAVWCWIWRWVYCQEAFNPACICWFHCSRSWRRRLLQTEQHDMKSHILLFILVARNICGASEMARKYRLHLFQFCSSVIATIFYCLAVAFFASPGLYFFIIIAQKFFIFSAMFYYSFAIVCLLLSKLFSKKTALIMTFGFMILCVAFFGATDSIEFYVISLLPLMTYMFFIYVYINNRVCWR